MFGFHVAAVPVTDTDNLNDYRLVLHKTFVYPGYRRAVRTLRPGSTKRVSQSWLAGCLTKQLITVIGYSQLIYTWNKSQV